jgi:hypothetical protein
MRAAGSTAREGEDYSFIVPDGASAIRMPVTG